MTTLSFDHSSFSVLTTRPRQVTFAAQLAALRAHLAPTPALSTAGGVLARAALAVVPVSALVWMFATL